MCNEGLVKKKTPLQRPIPDPFESEENPAVESYSERDIRRQIGLEKTLKEISKKFVYSKIIAASYAERQRQTAELKKAFKKYHPGKRATMKRLAEFEKRSESSKRGWAMRRLKEVIKAYDVRLQGIRSQSLEDKKAAHEKFKTFRNRFYGADTSLYEERHQLLVDAMTAADIWDDDWEEKHTLRMLQYSP